MDIAGTKFVLRAKQEVLDSFNALGKKRNKYKNFKGIKLDTLVLFSYYGHNKLFSRTKKKSAYFFKSVSTISVYGTHQEV